MHIFICLIIPLVSVILTTLLVIPKHRIFFSNSWSHWNLNLKKKYFYPRLSFHQYFTQFSSQRYSWNASRVCISEIWWNRRNKWAVAIPQYRLYRQDREGRVGGCVALNIKQSIAKYPRKHQEKLFHGIAMGDNYLKMGLQYSTTTPIKTRRTISRWRWK